MTFDSQTSGGRLTRSQFLSLLDSAILQKEFGFARVAALSWLAQIPGDLQVACSYARALVGLGRFNDAAHACRHLLAKDPEYSEALLLARQACELVDAERAQFYAAWQYALEGTSYGLAMPAWAHHVRAARAALQQGNDVAAETHLLETLGLNLPTPLVAITHLQILQARSEDTLNVPNQALIKIGEYYAGTWKECLQIQLLLARAYLDAARGDEAVALLHQVASLDSTGQVISRMWGTNHPYRGLWPSALSGTLATPIPAAVANTLGWNQLTAGDAPASDADQPAPEALALPHEGPIDDEIAPSEVLHDTQVELERIAARLKQPELATTDGRYAVYVILSTRQGLVDQYGPAGYLAVREAMESLRQAVDARPGWRAITFLADEPASTTACGARPVRASDPWAMKLALAELDAHLQRHGEMLAALLIVGGPRVVPFHHLPNPVDDVDLDVPSDNPYGTRDENYFVTEWPVGRLPGDDTDDPVPLLKALQTAMKNHAGEGPQEPWYRRLWHKLLQRLSRTRRLPGPAFGYTAAIWRQAARAVFQPIGDGDTLLVSPPADAAAYRRWGRLQTGWGYFNLHGIPDAAEWFGHNDPAHPIAGADYPVALRPDDVQNGGISYDIVFSEACYGALICGKQVRGSLALTMLSSGARGFIGSTCTAYGSLAAPLIAADLLAHAFWKLAKQDIPLGEALRRAKIGFIHDMHSRQGYLDGEDQKTLISFILYGDPLARPFSRRKLAKEIQRPLRMPEIHTACDRDGRPDAEQLNEQVQVKVKQVVQHYLPGMLDAEIRINTVRYECPGEGHNCPTAQIHTKGPAGSGQDRQVVVLRKAIKKPTQTYYQYARLTLDGDGKVVKLAVSR